VVTGVVREEYAKRVEEWREGMRALAALPQVYVKLSMLEYTSPGWQKDPEAKAIIKKLVREVSAYLIITPTKGDITTIIIVIVNIN